MQRVRLTPRIVITLLMMIAPFVIALLLTYETVKIDFPSFMEDQPSIRAQEGPRRLPPEESVPLYRPPLEGDKVLENPVPADAVSLQRGEILFSLHCAQCHGDKGLGDGPIVQFWGDKTNKPANLTDSRIASQPDGALYLTLTQGFGAMPALSENLTPRQRWDVINYVRSLEGTSTAFVSGGEQ